MYMIVYLYIYDIYVLNDKLIYYLCFFTYIYIYINVHVFVDVYTICCIYGYTYYPAHYEG